jgi:hypothetical protein
MYLKDRLAQKLGRREGFWIWWDHVLPRNQPLTPELESKIRETSILVVVLSRGYRFFPGQEYHKTFESLPEPAR